MGRYVLATLMERTQLAEGIFSAVLRAEEIASAAKPGQFVCVYSDDGAHLLPRPISICNTDVKSGTVRLVYRVVGFGTEELSRKEVGAKIRVLGPIGTGYEKVSEGKDRPIRIAIGGGIGIPPMLLLARKWCEEGYEVHAVMGYRNKDTFLIDELSGYAVCHIATDDGSVGTHGTVLDAIESEGLLADGRDGKTLLAACGPMPMLRGIARLAGERNIPAYVSLEERMACGVGACLGCITKTREVDGHSHVHNARICTEGPVFNVNEICLV